MAYGFTYTLPTVTGSHSSMPILLKGGDFPAAAIDGTANAIDNGGGNLIAYTSSDKKTKLPIEVVTFVSGLSPQAEVWVKLPSVETGATMKQNGLSVVQDIMTSSTYLIANKNSYIAKKDEVLDIYEKINSIVNP